jgi:hypothetical protein
VAGVLLAGITARANPVAATPVDELVNIYMASETLRVTISPTDAVFNASFIFKPDHKPPENVPVVVRLPIWFPQNSTEDFSVAEFWATFGKENEDGVSTAREKRVFDRAIGLNISAGNRQVMAGHPDFFIATPTNWGPDNVTAPLELRDPPFFEDVPRAELQSPGYVILVMVVWSDSDTVLNGKPVTMTYRQPVVRSRGEGHFFYLPIFENLPRDISTADTNHYSITMAAAPGCSLAITAGNKKVMVASSQSVTLGADRDRPIRAVVDCPGYSPKSPADGWSDLYRYKTNFDDGEFSRDYSNQLCFFVVRETPVAGARYVDLPRYPKLGFIKDEPDLIVTNLFSVETRVETLYNGRAVVKGPIIDVGLGLEDGESMEELMKRDAGKTILVTCGGKVLDASPAMATFRPVEDYLWDVTNSDEVKDQLQTLKPLVGANSPKSRQ